MKSSDGDKGVRSHTSSDQESHQIIQGKVVYDAGRVILEESKSNMELSEISSS